MNKTKGTEGKETFESSLKSLEELVRALESGDKGLEESLALFEKGVALSKTLTKQLEDAKHKVETLTKENGKAVKRPLQAD